MKFDTYTLREYSIKIPTPQTFSDVVELVSSDYYRKCERELHIGHSMCMVINGSTIIGNNVNVSQFLNIGSNSGPAAFICDGAYIVPMVCLVGNVVIGNNSIVGAGAVVTKDVSSKCTVAGVPAKRINDKYTSGWHFYKQKRQTI